MTPNIKIREKELKAAGAAKQQSGRRDFWKYSGLQLATNLCLIGLFSKLVGSAAQGVATPVKKVLSGAAAGRTLAPNLTATPKGPAF